MTLVDGEATGLVPADDRGLAYGDGAFETIRATRGVAPWLARHHARLAATCAALGFVAPEAATLAAEIAEVSAGATRAVVKVIVTRGSGGRGYAPPAPVRPRRIVAAHPWPAHPPERWSSGVRIATGRTRLAREAPLAGAKHLGRIAQVLARAEPCDPTIDEVLMLDTAGEVVECTASNLFAVVDGSLLTPPILGAGVAGIARGWILEHAALLGGAAERRLLPADLERASELFVCNAIVGAWPVRELDGRAYPVGPRSARIRDALFAEGCGP
jgi:4-amino-4-deoxychorismate lyase